MNTTQHETQQSISAWAEETFGPVSTNIRVAARANEEMAELLRLLTVDDKHPEAGQEIADVTIILFRLADRIGAVIELVPDPLRPYARTNIRWAVWAHHELSSVLSLLSCDDHHELAPENVQTVVMMLVRLAQALGLDLQAEIDAKMAINRQRVWKRDGSGHGYHTREKGDSGEQAALRAMIAEAVAEGLTNGRKATFCGRSAQDWSESYDAVRDALAANLGQFIFDDDEAEESLLIEGIEGLGRMLREVQVDPESGTFEGPVHFDDFPRAALAKVQGGAA